jgi:hypothetical protein
MCEAFMAQVRKSFGLAIEAAICRKSGWCVAFERDWAGVLKKISIYQKFVYVMLSFVVG